MGLREYREKRNFRKTPEPSGPRTRTGKNIFVIQKHDASHLHYDFRLELDGTLKSWAVPKGPSLDPAEKRLAMQVEDHPIGYASFEGIIPKGEYGGGEVIVWDTGSWKPVGDPREGYRKGRLEFTLEGKKLKGAWLLFRIRGNGERAQWLLVKRHDEAAHPTPDREPIVETRPESVISKRLLTRDQKARGLPKSRTIAVGARVWHSKDSDTPGETPVVKKKRNERPVRGLGFVEPELATLVDAPPVGEKWIHEIKFDGYRTIVELRNGKPPKFFTRKGLDWSKKYSALAAPLRNLEVRSALLDGEIVALDSKGRSDFGALQAALKDDASASLIYYVFDLLELDGKDLRALPLEERKERLKEVLDGSDSDLLRYSDHAEGDASKILAKGCELGLEGVISKDRHAPYVSGREGQWLKSKCRQGQEVVIAGYTPPHGGRKGFGSLVMAAREEDGYRYLGRVGTGFDGQKIRMLLAKMGPLETDESPFEEKVPLQSSIQWVKPKLVAEIGFHGWTADRHIRQGVFRGLREDKPAREVTLDRAKKPEEARGSVKLTHPEKILIPEGKLTKAALRDYLVGVSDWMLPHLIDRPLALVRCPDDTHHECFFQKRLMPGKHPGLRGSEIDSPKGTKSPVLSVESTTGLESLAQMGVLEIHPWGTHLRHPLKPDLIVFDLDPDDSVPWAKIAGAALRLRDVLEGLGLRSFLKVSGNKGLHLHVPIEPKDDWETVKNFAHAVALILVGENPELYLATMSKAKRKGKIFIDFFRNGYGATSVAPYSVRTKNGGAIALPIDWKDVKKVDPKGFHIKGVLKTLARRKPGGAGDPWRDYFKVEQRLPPGTPATSGKAGVRKAGRTAAPKAPGSRARARAR